MPHPYWPLFDLVVRTPILTLRYIDDALAVELATLISRPIHDPDKMPFAVPWTDAPEPTARAQGVPLLGPDVAPTPRPSRGTSTWRSCATDGPSARAA